MKFLLFFILIAFVAVRLEAKGTFKSSVLSSAGKNHDRSTRRPVGQDTHTTESGYTIGIPQNASGHSNHSLGGPSSTKTPESGNHSAGILAASHAPNAPVHGQDSKTPTPSNNAGNHTTGTGIGNNTATVDSQGHILGHGQRTKTPSGNTGTLAKFSSEQTNHHLKNTTRNHNHTDQTTKTLN